MNPLKNMAEGKFKRRILVCVTGLTPQVVTETVYALAMQTPSWLPTEVHILTTVTGAGIARSLLTGDDGQFTRLCRDYALPPIAFDESRIHVLSDASGQALDDIRSPDDNMAMADAILARIADFAADTGCALHVSLAGGRKSMGFFAGYALSLYGRAQDRLSHVLLSPGFETNPAFFYPPRIPTVLSGRNGETLDTSDARIDLADIPFVRLRDRLPPELLSGGRFVDAVTAAQNPEGPRLRVCLSAQKIVCGNEVIALSEVGFAIYAWHAQRAVRLKSPDVSLHEFNAAQSALRRDLAEFGQRLYDNPMSRAAQRWEECRWDDDRIDFSQWLAERRSRINEAIRRSLGKVGEQIYGIASTATGGRSRSHRLPLARNSIAITRDAQPASLHVASRETSGRTMTPSRPRTAR